MHLATPFLNLPPPFELGINGPEVAHWKANPNVSDLIPHGCKFWFLKDLYGALEKQSVKEV